MTAETTGTVDDGWRGVANEEEDADPAGTGLRLQARARRLLGTLIRPHRRAVAAALLLLVAQSAAELAGPLLVAYAIDTGIPAAVAGDAAPLVVGDRGLRGHGRGVGGVPRGLPPAHRAGRPGRARRRAGDGMARRATAGDDARWRDLRRRQLRDLVSRELGLDDVERDRQCMIPASR